jgi:hypothetical protein
VHWKCRAQWDGSALSDVHTFTLGVLPDRTFIYCGKIPNGIKL